MSPFVPVININTRTRERSVCAVAARWRVVGYPAVVENVSEGKDVLGTKNIRPI